MVGLLNEKLLMEGAWKVQLKALCCFEAVLKDKTCGEEYGDMLDAHLEGLEECYADEDHPLVSTKAKKVWALLYPEEDQPKEEVQEKNLQKKRLQTKITKEVNLIAFSDDEEEESSNPLFSSTTSTSIPPLSTSTSIPSLSTSTSIPVSTSTSIPTTSMSTTTTSDTTSMFSNLEVKESKSGFGFMTSPVVVQKNKEVVIKNDQGSANNSSLLDPNFGLLSTSPKEVLQPNTTSASMKDPIMSKFNTSPMGFTQSMSGTGGFNQDGFNQQQQGGFNQHQGGFNQQQSFGFTPPMYNTQKDPFSKLQGGYSNTSPLKANKKQQEESKEKSFSFVDDMLKDY